MTGVHEAAKLNIEDAQVNQERYHDRKYTEPSSRIVDKVLINNSRRVRETSFHATGKVVMKLLKSVKKGHTG